MIDNKYVEYAAHTGEVKMEMLENDLGRYMVRSMLAGMYLTIVVFVFWSLGNNLHESPFGKVLASAFFGVGLSIIVLTNTELFTSNNFYMTVSSTTRKTSWGKTLYLWAMCWIGNLIGACIVGALLYFSGLLSGLPADHALFTGAEHKVHQTALVIFSKGILANWVVCLAVRIALRCQDEIAKIAILILVVFMFLYFGGEHSIANMGTFSQALLAGGPITFGEACYNLFYSTLGNIVGGAVFMALPFAYINPRQDVDGRPH